MNLASSKHLRSKSDLEHFGNLFFTSETKHEYNYNHHMFYFLAVSVLGADWWDAGFFVLGLGLALSGAVGDVVGESESTDDSVGDMWACWIAGWVVGSGAGMVDVLGDGG